MLHADIKHFLGKTDQERDALSYQGEIAIASEIKEIINKDQNYNPTDEDRAEQIAFDFMADYQSRDIGWGTYYGPILILKNRQGEVV
jgi:hypothetical protein